MKKPKPHTKAWKKWHSNQTKKAMKNLPESSIEKMRKSGRKAVKRNAGKKCPWTSKRNKNNWKKKSYRIKMAKATSENMKRLHKDPEFARRHAKRHSKLMKERNKDPRYVAKSLKRAQKAMRAARRNKKRNGYCEICEIHCFLLKDHSHKFNKKQGRRGKLCVNCNLGLGYFKDNPKFLRRAEKYIKKYSKKLKKRLKDA